MRKAQLNKIFSNIPTLMDFHLMHCFLGAGGTADSEKTFHKTFPLTVWNCSWFFSLCKSLTAKVHLLIRQKIENIIISVRITLGFLSHAFGLFSCNHQQVKHKSLLHGNCTAVPFNSVQIWVIKPNGLPFPSGRRSLVRHTSLENDRRENLQSATPALIFTWVGARTQWFLVL